MSILQNIDHGESNYKIFKKNIYLNYLQKGKKKTEALKSLYRSPGYKKKQLVPCKKYVLQW